MISMLVGLTACGDDEDDDYNSSSRRKNSEANVELEEKDDDNTKIDDKAETKKSNSKGNFKKSSNNATGDTYIVAINKDETRLVIKDKLDFDAKYYITDMDGKIITEIGRVTNVYNGTWISTEYTKIVDFNGKEIYTLKDINLSDIIDISESGYIIKKNTTESMADGKVTKYQIYDPLNDKVLLEHDGEIQYSGEKDYFELAAKSNVYPYDYESFSGFYSRL